MSARKNQHFNPQFLLRRFSEQGNQNAISLFNISSQKVVGGASIKSQASRSFLYGRDGTVESVLSGIESRVAPIIDKIARTRRVPAIGSLAHQRLVLFMAVQGARHPAAGAEVTAMRAAFVAEIAKLQLANGKTPHVDDSLLPFATKHPEVAAIQSALASVATGDDLGCVLIENDANIEFCLSDLGVVAHNQWRQGSGSAHVSTPSMGVQIFLPIGPRRLLALYDVGVYRLRRFKNDVNPRVVNDEEVREFNRLAMEDAHENIYFSGDARTAAEISTPVARTAPRHRATSHAAFHAGTELLILTYRKPTPARLSERVFLVRPELPPEHNDLNALARPHAEFLMRKAKAHPLPGLILRVSTRT